MKKIKLMCAGMALVVAMSAPQVASAKMLPTPIEEESTATGTTVGATDADTTVTGSATVEAALSGEVRNLSLDEAIDIALEDNYDVLAMKNSLEQIKLSKDSQDRLVKKMDKYLSNANSTLQSLVYMADLYDTSVESLEAAYDMQVSGTKMQVIAKYYTALNAEKYEDIVKQTYENAQAQLKNVEARYNQGMATKLEKLQAEVSVNSAKLSWDSAKSSTVQAKRSLSLQLGADVETNWKLTTPMKIEPVVIEDVDAKVEELLAEAPIIRYTELGLETARKQYEYDSAGIKGTNAGTTAALTYESAKLDYENTMSTQRATAKNMLENLNLAYSQYLLSDESVKLAEEAYRLTKLQYENGLNTQTDVDTAAISLANTEYTRLQAMLQYNLYKTCLDEMLIHDFSA